MVKSKRKTTFGPDLKAFFDFILDISREKGLSKEKVTEVVEGSFISAYQKRYGMDADLSLFMDEQKPELFILRRRKVVENVEWPDREINLEQARREKPDVQIGDVLEDRDNPFEFSRIGATNVRQLLMQRLRELEREIIYDHFKGREGELVHGFFLRWRDHEVMYVDLGRTEGILPRREQIPGERFRSGDQVKAVIKSVELRREKSREPGPFITLSRGSPQFVQRLFEQEIPEINEGIVEVLDIARQPSYRTKILVRSHRADVDPVGACVGIKGVRIQSIVRELGNERIDIVNFSSEPEELITNALSPARTLDVRVDRKNKEVFVVVPDDSYSLAIGASGQNVRLASQISGYHIVVRSESQFNQEMASPEARAQLNALFRSSAEEKQAQLDYTPLSELPGLTRRVIEILEQNDIKSVEQLVEMKQSQLEEIPDVGKTTARQIIKILSESVEYEDA